jgi:hypothetical protein
MNNVDRKEELYYDDQMRFLWNKNHEPDEKEPVHPGEGR